MQSTLLPPADYSELRFRVSDRSNWPGDTNEEPLLTAAGCLTLRLLASPSLLRLRWNYVPGYRYRGDG